MSAISTRPIMIEGTLDLVTPPIAMLPGRAVFSKNYEPVARGAQRVPGYERYDGQPKPSSATYWTVNFDAGTAAITEGQTVTGATSGATGKALTDAIVSTGSYGAGNAAGYLVLTNVTGTFQDNENLQVSAVTKSIANGTQNLRGAATDALDTTYFRDAVATARALIAKPTGADGILGVWKYKGIRYCVRDNVGGTAGVLYKSSSSGWVACDLGRSIDFTSGGTTEPAEGDTLTGATSGATAVVKRIIVTSGSWAAGDAAGRMILYSQTGTFQSENINDTTQSASNVLTIAGNSTANTLAPDGTYRFTTHNFYGSSGTVRMYGVNGVGSAFEWDGTTFVPILTGMSVDKPTHIAAHKNQLCLAFRGGSLQNSSVGNPYEWDPVTGSGEIGIGEEIMDILPDWSDTLVVFGRNTLGILYGNDSDDFVFDTINHNAGAIENTAQLMDKPIYMDDTGLRRLSPSDAVFGNFNIGTLSLLIEPLLAKKRKDGVTVTASVVVKRKDQYRLFFSDATCLHVYFGRLTKDKLPRILPSTLDHVVTCACSTVCLTGDDENNEVTLYGTSDGWVMEADVGTSFDGEQITAVHRLAYSNLGLAQQKKKWQKAFLELDASPSTTLYISASFDYGNPNIAEAPEDTFDVYAGGGTWNQDDWNEFYWSSQQVGTATAYLRGVGVNMAPCFRSQSAYEEPHTLHGITYQLAPRGMVR